MVWLLVLSLYAAPSEAVDWDGPWKLGTSKVIGQPFRSEAECTNSAIQFIGKMHEGMLAPMRFKSIGVEGSLPKGATR
jgi:hypothetical protein